MLCNISIDDAESADSGRVGRGVRGERRLSSFSSLCSSSSSSSSSGSHHLVIYYLTLCSPSWSPQAHRDIAALETVHASPPKSKII